MKKEMAPSVDKVGDFSFSQALDYSQGNSMNELGKYVDDGFKKQAEFEKKKASDEAAAKAKADQQAQVQQHRQAVRQSIVQVKSDDEDTKEEPKGDAPPVYTPKPIPPEGFKMHSHNITGPFVYDHPVDPKQSTIFGPFGFEIEDIKNTHDTGRLSAMNEDEPEPTPDPNSWANWQLRQDEENGGYYEHLKI
uniref:Uncharacterized protein n=1 Tax=Strombidium inclinatum TaxID=197538 RepID=A0A7S3MW86_9SPIT|mmetsp:Transcript_2049/g.3069  ORF Transcript_2049/g.3069 Transcript_2049/m.3069 type:complete len:192 (+) Transcript_2049:139-714(+)